MVDGVGVEGKVDVDDGEEDVGGGVEGLEKVDVVVVEVGEIEGGVGLENGKMGGEGKVIEHVAER